MCLYLKSFCVFTAWSCQWLSVSSIQVWEVNLCVCVLLVSSDCACLVTSDYFMSNQCRNLFKRFKNILATVLTNINTSERSQECVIVNIRGHTQHSRQTEHSFCLLLIAFLLKVFGISALFQYQVCLRNRCCPATYICLFKFILSSQVFFCVVFDPCRAQSMIGPWLLFYLLGLCLWFAICAFDYNIIFIVVVLIIFVSWICNFLFPSLSVIRLYWLFV